jgi:putative Mg2+ transporter-C (MgtC) family protein
MDPLSVLGKLMIAAVCGGIVGWQREARDRPAGLRTHMLVCLGAAVYGLASQLFAGPNSDPSRVASQVATGMGFLGAGTIIRYGNAVRGLTTAASLWAVAAIGICVAIGGDALWVAGIATLIVLATLTVFRKIEVALVPHAHTGTLTLQLADAAAGLATVRQLLGEHKVTIETVGIAAIQGDGNTETQLRVTLPSGCDLPNLGIELSKLPGFVSLRCE